MNTEELDEMDKMEVLTFYTRDYKDNLISEIADTVMELKEIAQLPGDSDVLLFFLKRFKVEDFSKLTEEKVPLFKAKLKELYEQVERWKEIDPVVYASVFQFERSVSYPSLDELYELVDLLVHQNHNPSSGTITSTLNAKEIKVIEYTYLRWAMELHRCNERYAKRFLEDCERDLEKEMKAYRESLGDKWVPPKKLSKEEIKEMAKDLAITLIENEKKKDKNKE
uniref:UBA-like domain protein n=1 Tax=Myoviridae sp. ctLnO19 TaxID=2825085 RepID=A0A8S5P013_9CAUD|nr:MAG TPA: UBA-like domain protein [Myoviridae sp. ctLnO19]